MKRLSINNGLSYTTKYSAAIKKLGWDTIVNYMDDDARSEVASEFERTDREFLIAYLKRASEDLIIG